MTIKAIGKTFGDEIIAAGLGGLSFSWGDDGVFQFSDQITDAQKEAVLAVYEVHNPMTT